MKASQLVALLTKLVPRREPVLVVGSPGIGKTDVITSTAAELGFDVIVTHPVVDEPIDYKGLPGIVDCDDRKVAQFLPFGELERMIDAQQPTLVFMDDLGQAPPAVQAAIMQLILARQINGHPVSEHVSFVAATNRRTDRAAVQGMISPLLDRFTAVLPMEFDVEEWVAWGLQNGMPFELLAFARFRPDTMNQFAASDARDMRKSPTPRSIAGLGRLVNLGIQDLEVLVGAAGESFATEFLGFLRTFQEMPDRTQVYLNPETADVPTRPDVLYAFMGALAHFARAENIEQTVRYLARVRPEFSALCMKDAALRHGSEVTATAAFVRWSVDNQELFGFST